MPAASGVYAECFTVNEMREACILLVFDTFFQSDTIAIGHSRCLCVCVQDCEERKKKCTSSVSLSANGKKIA